MLHDESTAQNEMGGQQPPVEGGQSEFAAIAEIVALLDADPSTDWSQVSIDALREHLVNMDRLILQTRVHTELLDGRQIRFQVRGTGKTVRAIQNMVPAHAEVVNGLTEWMIDVQNLPDGADMIISVSDPAELVRLQALGFFGFMAIGAHHQVHHLQMATGQGH